MVSGEVQGPKFPRQDKTPPECTLIVDFLKALLRHRGQDLIAIESRIQISVNRRFRTFKQSIRVIFRLMFPYRLSFSSRNKKK